MVNFKNIGQLMSNPTAGLIGSAIQRSGPGMVYGAANVATQAITGKTIPQHIMSSSRPGGKIPKGPSKGPVAKQAAKPTPFAQESIKRGGYGHGGVVSHKSISACEKAMTRKK